MCRCVKPDLFYLLISENVITPLRWRKATSGNIIQYLIAVFVFVVGLNLNTAKAQIINIETKRFYNDTIKWAGEADLQINIAENPTRNLYIGNKTRIQYQKDLHRVVFLNDLGIANVGGKSILNSGYQHLRYAYKHHPLFNFEAFVQHQYNKPMKMDFRGLLGAGERLKVLEKDKNRIYVGLSLMLEHERARADEIYFTDLRWSSYINCYLDITKEIYFVNTFYYQPKIGNNSDFRLADEGSVVIKIKKWLSFTTSLNILYDTKQPPGVTNTIYEWRNRLMFVL